ncbi:MAG: replicative DNA helicase [Anaerolineaceae bacterium]|nr:replicative DNA helicase [Anaerolineaceae bacterium]
MSDFLQPEEINTAEIQAQPHSREAEEAVIGSVLINPEAYFDLAQFLEPDDFFIIRNQWIWESFSNLTARRIPFDYLTVASELEQLGHLEDIGGAAYLTSLITKTPTSLHAEAYGRIIEEHAIRRKMLSSANNLAKLAFDKQHTIETVLQEAEKSIFGISEKRMQRDVQSIKKVVSDVYDRISILSSRDESVIGVPTGLNDLDNLLGGLQKSDLLIVAGRPGSGKTGFLLSVAKNAGLIYKKKVAMFSLEMSNEQLVQRLIAQETGIDTKRLRTGKLMEDEWPLFTEAFEKLSDTRIFLDDTPAITPLQLRTKCRRLHLEHGLDLIIVDYLQLMSGDHRGDNRVQEVSQISRNLKVLARELDVPVLTAAQLSRAVEQRADKRPMLSDLRESGSLEQDADIVMFIHRPDALEKDESLRNITELIVAKHRNGPTHPGIQLVFLDQLASFVNAAQGEQPY